MSKFVILKLLEWNHICPEKLKILLAKYLLADHYILINSLYFYRWMQTRYSFFVLAASKK